MLISIKKYQEFQLFAGSSKLRMIFFLLINVKMPTIVVGILIFISRKSFMLRWVEHEFFLYPRGPGSALLAQALDEMFNI